MTNEELKKKIVEIIDTACAFYCGSNVHMDDEQEATIADALIAAGLTFDKTTAILAERANAKTLIHKAQYYDEIKHRAEIAERALDKAVELAYEYRTEADTLSCSSCPMGDELFPKCKDRGLYKECSKRWKEQLIEQAECELAEEREI